MRYFSSSQPSRLARLGVCISPALHSCSYPEIDSDCFDAVNSLKLLITQGDDLRCIFSRASPSLIWLRWSNCLYSWIPWWIPLEHLRVLELNSQLNFTSLWGSRVKVLIFRRLAVFYLSMLYSLQKFFKFWNFEFLFFFSSKLQIVGMTHTCEPSIMLLYCLLVKVFTIL